MQGDAAVETLRVAERNEGAVGGSAGTVSAGKPMRDGVVNGHITKHIVDGQ